MDPFTLRAIRIVTIIISMQLMGCMGASMQSSGSPSKYYETFFIDEGVTQYYIKPVEFESDDEEMKLDALFRNGASDTATINFTIVGSRILKTINNLSLSNGTTTATAYSVKNLYTEKDGSEYVSRFTSRIHRDSIYSLFVNEAPWEVSVKAYDTTTTFRAESSARKMRAFVNESLIRVLLAK